jgi:hypothetical protein
MALLAAGCGTQGGQGREASPAAAGPKVISPGCRKAKVQVAKVYLGKPGAHWPTPTLDLATEMRGYEDDFARMKSDFADVQFVVNELVTSDAQARALKEKLANVDGVLAIHLSMGVLGMVREIAGAGKPLALFAAPYSGHEWTGFGQLRKQPEGAMLECFLTSDRDQLAVAVRPFRAIHHLREARILDVTTREVSAYAKQMKGKFGTDIVQVPRARVLEAYQAVPEAQAAAEARKWIDGAEKIIEPSREEIVKSLRLALAFENLLDAENATLITVDCYGSMWRQLPAYPCIGFARLNGMGLGGMCESDLQSAMTQIILQGLSGRPGFVSDPTMDVSAGSIILAHCMGTPRMDGPDRPAAPYRIRTIMERQEGAVTQVRMRVGQKVTQAQLVSMDTLIYFTGEIVEAPDLPRGCRTKVVVKVDGDPEKLWQNWSHGLHRVTCYGDLVEDLKRFARFTNVRLVNEA